MVLGWFWDELGMILRQFWDDFEMMLGRLWDDFGTIPDFPNFRSGGFFF
jgi:hypothetical protein